MYATGTEYVRKGYGTGTEHPLRIPQVSGKYFILIRESSFDDLFLIKAGSLRGLFLLREKVTNVVSMGFEFETTIQFNTAYDLKGLGTKEIVAFF